MVCEAKESLLPRRTQRGNELRDLVAVARVAAGDPLLDLVERDDECVPGAHAGEPCHRVDGLGEKADVLRGQPARIDVGDDLGGIERLGAEPVVHDVMPDLEDEETADQRLVEAPAAEEIEVVQIAELAPPPPRGELFPS